MNIRVSPESDVFSNYSNDRVERIVERVKEVPVMPERELTAAELDYLTHVADQRHREKIIGAVAGGVVGVGIVAGVGWLVTHMSMS